MRNSRSYQLVSEHSILSAQMKNKVAAMEEFLEKQALHSKPEWKEELDTIKKRLERRRSRCDELSEKDFEIYLEMKLQWLQQYYVTAKSQAPEKKTREPEEDGWNEPDFKVYDRGRGKTENPNSRRRRSREDEFDEKLEEMAEILRSYLANVAVKSSKPEESRETKEPERETDQNEGSIPWNVIAKLEPEVDERRSDREPLNGQRATEAQREELPEDSLLQKPNNGVIMAATSSLIDLGEISLACVTVLCEREKKGEDEELSETKQSGKSSPKAATVVAEGIAHGEEEPLFSFSVEGYDGVAIERESKSKQNSRQMDLKFNSLVQAQSLIVTPPQFTNNRGVLQEKTEIGQKKEGIIFNSKAGGLDKTMDSPITLLTVEDKAFDPGNSFSAFGIARSSCFKLWDPGGRLLMIVFLIFLYLYLEDKVNV